MKVQNRLSLFSSFIFGVIFAFISLLIYTLYSHTTEKSVYRNLKKTSLITAIFFLEEDELNKEEFSKAQRQFEEFVTNSFYQVYNEQNIVSYGAQNLRISSDILSKIRNQGELAFRYDGFFCYGIFYEDNQGDFVVIVREREDILENQLKLLLWVLSISLILGILAIIVLSRWISSKAYKPFRDAITQVNNISANHLDSRITLPGTKDELEDLIRTFNELLEKISETFIIQKNFVNYVSHEFKTPLASMLGNLEVFSMKNRSPEEYRQLSQNLIQQINQLEEILNTLMIISDLRENTDISTSVRIDEIIWEIISKISALYNKSNISVFMEVAPEDEELLFVSGDSTQLLIALFNLIENAVKYSHGKPVIIHIINDKGRLSVSIEDEGIGIPTEQLEYISKPFYRADNTRQFYGSGIGLSIALRILEKRGIHYHIESKINKGTKITLLFD